MEKHNLQIEYRDVKDLHPYEGNVKRHPKKQIDEIVQSIVLYGFNDPIAVDENNLVIEGHGRLEAVKRLKYDKVPVIVLKGLTDDEKKQYIIVHNKLTMSTGFDIKKLQQEMVKLPTFDFSQFQINRLKVEDFEPVNERMNTVKQYNLDLYDKTETSGFYQMPIISNDGFIPSSLIGFNYANTTKNKKCGLHMFIDDYQFDRLWNSPDSYIDLLKSYECVLSPDFSLYMDMPMAMKVWNIYRSRLLGHYWQQCGIKVIPTISWAEPDTFSFCFDGIPEGSIVAVSTIGVKRQNDSMKIWTDGIDAMIQKIKPTTIIEYGGDIGYDYKGIEVVRFSNEVTERMKTSKKGK